MDAPHLSQQAFQNELLPGETLIWSGQPSRRIVFHHEDWYLIPLSLMWGGFAIAWELTVGGRLSGTKPGSLAFSFIGIPFVVMGQYLIWGRFFYAAWKKRKILYGLTRKRVLILDTAWKRSLKSVYIDQIPLVEKTVRSHGIGTLRFADLSIGTNSRWTARGFNDWEGGLGTRGVPTFVDIEDVETVFSIVTYLRDQTRASHG